MSPVTADFRALRTEPALWHSTTCVCYSCCCAWSWQAMQW